MADRACAWSVEVDNVFGKETTMHHRWRSRGKLLQDNRELWTQAQCRPKGREHYKAYSWYVLTESELEELKDQVERIDMEEESQ